MWINILSTLVAVFGLEHALANAAPKAWPWFRWSVLPPLAIVSTFGYPLGLIGWVPWRTDTVAIVVGLCIGVAAAVYGCRAHLHPRRLRLYRERLRLAMPRFGAPAPGSYVVAHRVRRRR